jgi:hypothetical protein
LNAKWYQCKGHNSVPRPKRATPEIVVDNLSKHSEESAIGLQTSFEAGFLATLREIAGSDLTPSRALDLLTRLIAEVPASSKEGLEQIKIMDKLLNTARAMMETRLKNEEVAEIARKLSDMETCLERLAAEKQLENKRPVEVWNGARPDK